MSNQKPVGLTKTQGWEVGVSRTLPLNNWEAWEIILDVLHLSKHIQSSLEKNMTFDTDDQTHVEIRSFEEGSLLRMKWQPTAWENNSTLQIRITPSQKGTRIGIHHELLEDAKQRETMRIHWTKILEDLKALIIAM